jgi:hypothetical protein
MLVAVTYTPRDTSEEKEKRSLALFSNWQRPTGYEEKGPYGMADGSGGIVIAEVASVVALLEAMAPWGPFFDIKAVPIVEISDFVPIAERGYAWRDSVP